MPYYIATVKYAWVFEADDERQAWDMAQQDVAENAGEDLDIEEITRAQAVRRSHGRVGKKDRS